MLFCCTLPSDLVSQKVQRDQQMVLGKKQEVARILTTRAEPKQDTFSAARRIKDQQLGKPKSTNQQTEHKFKVLWDVKVLPHALLGLHYTEVICQHMCSLKSWQFH